MAYSYKRCDRDQLFLMPTSMREWLPEGHLAWFVLDVVDKVDTSAFHARHPNDGVGRAAYDPEMLLATMMYAYCTNVRSSRRIEALCEQDIAYRVICANLVPDHATIARFRADHQAAIEGVFVDVLVLCAAAGLTSLGTIAIDGTKMGADASLAANRNIEAIRSEVAAILADAGATDAADDDRVGSARGDELPPELADPISRLARLETALARLEQLEAEAEAAEAARSQTAAEKAAAGHKVSGRKPRDDPDAAAARAEADLAVEKARAAADAERKARIEAAAVAGRKVGGPKPRKDPEAAVARAEADVAAAKARSEARLATRAQREAQAAAEGRKLRGVKPRRDPIEAMTRAEAALAAAKARAAEAAQRELVPTTTHAAVAQAEQRLAQARAAVRSTAASRGPLANTTDPDSRVMMSPSGFIQGYNAQAAVNENQVVIACGLTQEVNDKRQLLPMLAALADAIEAAGIVGGIGCVLADAGYWSQTNATAAGPDRLIATQKNWRQRRAARELGNTTGPPPVGSTPLEAMEHRLRTPEGAAAYSKRSILVEPVFGDHKENRGFRRFMRRGVTATQSEWSFINTTHNVMKLFRQSLPTGLPVPSG